MSYPTLGEGAFDALARADEEAWNAAHLPTLPGNMAPTTTTLPELVATAKVPPIVVLIGVAILLNWATGGKLFGKGGTWR